MPVAYEADPLQIIIFRRENDDESIEYEEEIIRALQGGKDPAAYLATGEDLGITLRTFSSTPPMTPTDALSGFTHTLVIFIIDQHFVDASADLWIWINDCCRVMSADAGSGCLPYAIDERSRRAAINRSAALGELEFGLVAELGEPTVRPAILALRVVHKCRLLLATELADIDPKYDDRLSIFISHAKLDGLPLAHSLLHQVESISWLKSFYDVKDIPVGSAWKKQLEYGIRSSIVVMLRTEQYDGRTWCRQEVLWADVYGVPAVLVDARIGLSHDPSFLPYDRIPVVRIPDGNLLRILFLALREGLRYALFAVRVLHLKQNGRLPKHDTLVVFSMQPSMAALLKACIDAPTGHLLILYPDPPLPSGLYEAAIALVNRCLPEASLLTPNSIFAAGAIG